MQERSRADEMVEQIISLEEEVEALTKENMFLRQHFSEQTISTGSAVQIISDRIKESTLAVLSALNTARDFPARDFPNRDFPGGPNIPQSPPGASARPVVDAVRSSVGTFRAALEDAKGIYNGLQAHLQDLVSECFSMRNRLREKERHLEMYAVLNQKLTAIKDEYLLYKDSLRRKE